MKKRITEKECLALYERYQTPSRVIGHCKAVSDAAVTIGEALNRHGYQLDISLIRGAGLAHDIARAHEDHAKVGARILRELDYLDEAEIVAVHMTYDFHEFQQLNETDLVCLGDRLVKEDQYVGLDSRIDYIIHKPGETKARTERILEKKAETRAFMDRIEEKIGQTIDSLLMKGNEHESK